MNKNLKTLADENLKKQKSLYDKTIEAGKGMKSPVIQEQPTEPIIPEKVEYPEGFHNQTPDLRFDEPQYIMGSTPLEMRDCEVKSIYELIGKEKPEEDKVLVIIQDGGIGDAVCATPMLEQARKIYPNKTIVVGSTHPEVLERNPNIDHLYHLAMPGNLFEKWVRPLKHLGSVRKLDIYNENAHKLFPGPLSMIWSYLYNLPWQNDDVKIYLTENEENDAKVWLSSFAPREVIIIHTAGAHITYNPKVQVTPNKDWFKDYWARLVSMLSIDYDVVQVGGPEEERIPGCSMYLMGGCSLRATCALLKYCLTYVGIDSFCNHAGPAVGKSGVVLFGRSNPYIAGHAINRNLWIDGSCVDDNLFCGRPCGYFGDSELHKGNMRSWECKTRSCMRALTPEIVYDQTIQHIKQLKGE
jgi:ADP-heptose:LPS heptosyltransferase